MDDSGLVRFGQYERLEHNGLGIYVNPDYPDWFAPNGTADAVLQAISHDTPRPGIEEKASDVGQAPYVLDQFLCRLPRSGATPYAGRAAHLKLDRLKECWFHVTNRCNLHCAHCMFSSGPTQPQQLLPLQLKQSVREAQRLGCQVFYFTGGEPLIYQELLPTCREILRDSQAHVVILTNGIALEALGDEILKLDRDRTHFQISLDGAEQRNDVIRGRGVFQRVGAGVRFLRANRFNVSLAMSVSRTNLDDMETLISIATSLDVKNVHYLWFFRKGKGDEADFVPAHEIAPALVRAYGLARTAGVLIDNVEIVKSQVFSLPGTRFDLSNAAWQSLAIGPDGCIYPSPALIGDVDMVAGSIADGIESVWGNSSVLRRIRHASVASDPVYATNPLKFLVGGGDIDHSFTSSGCVTGGDPYVELYNHIALEVIAEEAGHYRDDNRLALRSRMGERLYECGEGMGPVAFTHSNCVLSLPGKDGHTLVKNFYSAAATEPNEDIFNPVSYDESDIGHVPEESRVRSYGCGSPVLDGDLQLGETLVDLGSGTGVECFIAARKVGPMGRVIGIDMADAMLAVAEKSKAKVVENLGYDNITFKKAYFEQTPVDSDTVDVIISNCVINLSPDKRRTFSEMFRMLKPGGRAVISDICYEDDIPLDIKYNQKLRGECIGGAFKQDELFALVADVGFSGARIVKRFPYRTVAGYVFYSITYDVRKPLPVSKKTVLYRGPFAGVMTDDGRFLERGVTAEVELAEEFPVDDSVFVLDEKGAVTNVAQEMTCNCLVTPAASNACRAVETKHIAGCMVCGTELVYSQSNRRFKCYYCDQDTYGNVVCQRGHFVCDKCHAHDALSIIEEVCLGSTETDMVALMERIRNHPAFPLHGPEHHSMVPAIILTAYRNTTGKIDDEQVLLGMERGGAIAGGGCAFFGVCGAAVGVGIAFSVILRSDPYKGRERQIVQQATAEVLQAIGRYKAPRCCQRDCWVALNEVVRLSERYIGVPLRADLQLACLQSDRNRECVQTACPLYENRHPRQVPICECPGQSEAKRRDTLSPSGS
jgi:MoaA/NifB/PqqE/SkfB family radical SAM enzyme/SAM-dependent methyltransferase